MCWYRNYCTCSLLKMFCCCNAKCLTCTINCNHYRKVGGHGWNQKIRSYPIVCRLLQQVIFFRAYFTIREIDKRPINNNRKCSRRPEKSDANSRGKKKIIKNRAMNEKNYSSLKHVRERIKCLRNRGDTRGPTSEVKIHTRVSHPDTAEVAAGLINRN